MYIELDFDTVRDHYVLYQLVNRDGLLVHVGIVKFKALFLFNDIAPSSTLGKVYLSILETNPDPMKLAPRGLNVKNQVIHNKLAETVQSWTLKTGNRTGVECINTGEVFNNAKACAEAHNLTYNQLLQHLRGIKSFNTVKGYQYRRIMV